jgi:ketosteroid isomerase-like protein
MTPESGNAPNEAEIRRVLGHWLEAVRTRDSSRLTSNLSPDVLVFDLINPLQYVGADAVRERAKEWLSSFQGPIGYENRDLSITAGDDVAFCHSLNRISATNRDGKTIDMWWRATVCFRKVNGTWMVVHEHSSVPFDMESGRASLDLKP